MQKARSLACERRQRRRKSGFQRSKPPRGTFGRTLPKGIDAVTGGTNFVRANLEFVAFNSGFAGNNFDDRQIAEFGYNLCTAVLGGHTNSPEVKETVRKILRLANSSTSVIVYGRVQEFNGVKHITAKEAE